MSVCPLPGAAFAAAAWPAVARTRRRQTGPALAPDGGGSRHENRQEFGRLRPRRDRPGQQPHRTRSPRSARQSGHDQETPKRWWWRYALTAEISARSPAGRKNAHCIGVAAHRRQGSPQKIQSQVTSNLIGLRATSLAPRPTVPLVRSSMRSSVRSLRERLRFARSPAARSRPEGEGKVEARSCGHRGSSRVRATVEPGHVAHGDQRNTTPTGSALTAASHVMFAFCAVPSAASPRCRAADCRARCR